MANKAQARKSAQHTHGGTGDQFNNDSTGPQYNNAGPGNQVNTKINNTYYNDSQGYGNLQAIHPKYHKQRIENSKERLIPDACKWIYEKPEFKQWRSRSTNEAQRQAQPQNHRRDSVHGEIQSPKVLWIHGDDGTGKTMLLIDIIRVLEHETPKPVVSYFFCERDDKRKEIIDATAVLRGLIRLLLDREAPAPRLDQRYPRDLISTLASNDFSFGSNDSSYALSDMLETMIKAYGEDIVYLIIDSLDEYDCKEKWVEVQQRLRQIATNCANVRLLVSSRNACIETKNQFMKLDIHGIEGVELGESNTMPAMEDIELNGLGMDRYIDKKLRDIPYLERNLELLQMAKTSIEKKKSPTFPWVHRICEDLTKALGLIKFGETLFEKSREYATRKAQNKESNKEPESFYGLLERCDGAYKAAIDIASASECRPHPFEPHRFDFVIVRGKIGRADAHREFSYRPQISTKDKKALVKEGWNYINEAIDLADTIKDLEGSKRADWERVKLRARNLLLSKKEYDEMGIKDECMRVNILSELKEAQKQIQRSQEERRPEERRQEELRLKSLEQNREAHKNFDDRFNKESGQWMERLAEAREALKKETTAV